MRQDEGDDLSALHLRLLRIHTTLSYPAATKVLKEAPKTPSTWQLARLVPPRGGGLFG